MLSNKRIINVSSTVCIITVLLLSLIPIHPIQADSVSGETTFYFVDMLDETLPKESMVGSHPLISTLPPTNSTDKYYPPKLSNGLSANIDELAIWASFWAFDLLDELGELPDEYADLLNGFELLLPSPLRIVEAYEYSGNETVNISGDVSFNIYTHSKISSKIQQNDNVKISLFSMGASAILPTEIANQTSNITNGLLTGITPMTITLQNVDYKLKPDTSLFFSIEIIPGPKKVTSALQNNDSVIRTLAQSGLKLAETLINLSGNEESETILEMMDLITELVDELNISSDQITGIIDSLISTSIVYGSQTHPSSATVPFLAGDSEREDYISYYLHSDNTMDTTSPATSSGTGLSLLSETGSWNGPVLSRNKIISNVSAFLYIEHTDYRILADALSIEVSLLSNGNILGTSSQTLEKTKLLTSSINAYRFTFNDMSTKELSYGTKLQLQVGIDGATNGSSTLGQSVTLHYDSSQYQSFLSFKLSETDHLSVTSSSDPSDGKILPGGKVTYTLDIESELADTVTLSVRSSSFSELEQEQWDIDISPSTFQATADGQKTVTVTITSLNTTLSAYDLEVLDVIVDISGQTGFTSSLLSAEVSEDAVTYDFIIQKPEGENIVHGTNKTYQFFVTNNNTGIFPDGYILTATSDHFNVTISPLTVNDVSYNMTISVNVTVQVKEKTENDTDLLTFTVISKGSSIEKSVQLNSTIIGANVFEEFFDYFDSLAEQLGLKDTFGPYAAHLFVAIILIILFFIILLVAFILTTKFAQIICTERIAEIYPEEQAQYELTIRNPTNKTRSYSIDVDLSENGEKWQAVLDQAHLQIPAKQSKTVLLTVKGTDLLEADDWTQATVYVTPEGKRSCYPIALLTSVKDGAEDLKIDGVFHFPRRFDFLQTVKTSFKVRNNGHIQAKNLKVSLYINGKEKNKVEDVVIPAGGYADITLPWIAEKGKNNLHIVVS
jgi:hypothetical protein